MDFFSQREVACFQLLSRHFYHRVIPRALIMIHKKPVSLFTQRKSVKYRHRIFQWDGACTVRRKKIFDFYNMYTVQVKSDLYAFKHYARADPCEWWLLQMKESFNQTFDFTPKSPPQQRRDWPALANYKDQWIFLVGGYWHNELSSAEMFSVDRNIWNTSP